MTNVGSAILSAPPTYASIAGKAFEPGKQLRQNAKYVFDRTAFRDSGRLYSERLAW